MGLRFRKSFKIAPGVKLNINKKSTSVTFGTRGAHYTINSNGKRTKSVGIPGTGISYVETSEGKPLHTPTPKPDSPQSDSNLPENGGKKNKGCLMYLLYLLLILVAFFMIPILWIPGILVTAFFAIRKNPDKKKKRKRTLISGFITLFSFILFLNWPSSLEELQVNLQKQQFEITEKVSLDLEGSPEDAEISSLEISDNDIASVKYKDGKATLTFKKEGTASIYFIANGTIKSDKETITVIDPVAEAKREQAKKEAEEKKKAEQEAKRKAEEEARIKAEQEAKQKAEEEARIKAEQEAQRQAEEQARIKAEQEAQRQAALAAQQQNAQQSQSSSQQQVQTGGTVYWVASGEVYHSTPDCPTLGRSKNIYSGSIAESGKSRPCKVCH